jgi:hypothetical protein
MIVERSEQFQTTLKKLILPFKIRRKENRLPKVPEDKVTGQANNNNTT